jgi:hypothetical protein
MVQSGSRGPADASSRSEIGYVEECATSLRQLLISFSNPHRSTRDCLFVLHFSQLFWAVLLSTFVDWRFYDSWGLSYIVPGIS